MKAEIISYDDLTEEEKKRKEKKRKEACQITGAAVKNLRNLAKKVAAQYDARQGEDVEAWAEKLSNEVAKLSD